METHEALSLLRQYELVMTQEDHQIVQDVQRLEAERDLWRQRWDEAAARLRVPDSTNDGGPGNLREAIDHALRDYEVALREEEARSESLRALLRETPARFAPATRWARWRERVAKAVGGLDTDPKIT